MAKFTGVCIIKLDGNTLRTKPGASLSFGGFERTPVYANGALAGYTEEAVAATVSGTIAHGSDTDVALLTNAVDVTLFFQCDSGPEFQVRQAFASTPPELTGGEGDLTVEFMGNPAEQV